MNHEKENTSQNLRGSSLSKSESVYRRLVRILERDKKQYTIENLVSAIGGYRRFVGTR